MLAIVISAGVAASALNAGSSVFEREAAGTPEVKDLFSKRLALTIAKNKKFLYGVGLQLLATVMEIIALAQGSLLIVAPLLTLDLVFLLIFLHHRYELKVAPRNWAAVIGVVVGLTIFFLCTQANGGTIKYKFWSWAVTLGVIAIIIAGTIMIVPRLKSAKQRVGLLALATACSFGLNSGLLKLCINQLKSGGIEHLILNWPLYVLIFSAALSLYLTQNTLSSGSLVISQPIIEIVQPAVSIMIGIFIFDEDLRKSAWAIIGDVFSTILLLVCIYILARSDGLFVQRTSLKKGKKTGLPPSLKLNMQKEI
jgi:hypothetical protein